jgi:hypothetical protein
MSRIAFVTYRDISGLTPDDRLAVHFLRQRGIAVHAVTWDSPNVRWEKFDLMGVI